MPRMMRKQWSGMVKEASETHVNEYSTIPANFSLACPSTCLVRMQFVSQVDHSQYLHFRLALRDSGTQWRIVEAESEGTPR